MVGSRSTPGFDAHQILDPGIAWLGAESVAVVAHFRENRLDPSGQGSIGHLASSGMMLGHALDQANGIRWGAGLAKTVCEVRMASGMKGVFLGAGTHDLAELGPKRVVFRSDLLLWVGPVSN